MKPDVKRRKDTKYLDKTRENSKMQQLTVGVYLVFFYTFFFILSSLYVSLFLFPPPLLGI